MISFSSRPIWRSRQPIGVQHICSPDHTGASDINPKGWFWDPTVNVVGDPNALRVKANEWADTSVALLTAAHAQAVLFWQIEGGGPDVPFYFGTPNKVLDLNPEWLAGVTNTRTLEGSVIKEFLDRFTSAGIKVGFTLRPHNWNFSTLAWETSPNPTQTLFQKARWAYDHLQARLFYVDTNCVLPSDFPVLPAIVFEKLHRLMPDCLFIPEHEEGGYYAVTVPFADSADLYTPTPSYIRDYYPHAMRCVSLNGATPEQFNALLSSPTGRDIVAFESWWASPGYELIVGALGDGGTDGGP